jgi:predicted membrane chloride channel (bestrophin family)
MYSHQIPAFICHGSFVFDQTFVSIRVKLHYQERPIGDALATTEAQYENLSQNLVYVGGFLLFFLVFYVNQNHHRYFCLHQDSMKMMGRVNDVATLAKAILPMERARRINRFMNAAHVAMYTGLSSTYEKDNFFDPLEARFALLTDEELYRVVEEMDVDNSGPKAAFELITWIMCDIRDAQINSFIDTNEAYQLRELVLGFRSTVAKVFVTTTLPIPFFYVHFLSMLTAVYLPLFAIVVALETGFNPVDVSVNWGEIVSGLVVFLQALFVIGLRILGQQLSDPYGGDLIDLQIARYVNMILNGSNQILAAKRLHPPSVETELRLQLKMSSLGQAFEYDTDDEVVVQH